MSNSKLYALSKSGRVYALSTRQADQDVKPDTPVESGSWWNVVSWIWKDKPNVDFAELHAASKLSRGERCVQSFRPAESMPD